MCNHVVKSTVRLGATNGQSRKKCADTLALFQVGLAVFAWNLHVDDDPLCDG